MTDIDATIAHRIEDDSTGTDRLLFIFNDLTVVEIDRDAGKYQVRLGCEDSTWHGDWDHLLDIGQVHHGSPTAPYMTAVLGVEGR